MTQLDRHYVAETCKNLIQQAFGQFAAEIRRSSMETVANQLALHDLLVDKGVITADEFQRARIKALARLDQAIAQPE